MTIASLLAVDAGNTNVVLGLFRGRRLTRTWRIPSQTADVRRLAVRLPKTDRVLVSSVVPRLNPSFQALAKRVCGRPAAFVSIDMKMPIRVHLENPREAGQDRIVNAAAAFDRWKTALIVVDLGTATTFDVITARGDYVGGAISPGIGIANLALHEKTSLLPLVPIRKPRRAIAKNTVDAIRSGVFYGYVGLIDGMIERLKKELGVKAKVIATGGLSAVIGRASRLIDHVDPDITLKGLRLLADWNPPL